MLLPKLSIHLLGQFQVLVEDNPISFSSRPTQSLLSFLLLHSGKNHRREKLAGLLWPESDEKSARTNLRHALWRLRKIIGDEYIFSDKLTISFVLSPEVYFDVDRLKSSPETIDDLIEAGSTYDGELLPGFYEDWVAPERDRVDIIYDGKMQRLIHLLLEERRWSEAVDWSERWIAMRNAPEAAFRALMVAYRGLGESAKIQESYERCAAALQSELDVRPSQETTELLNNLLAEGMSIASQTADLAEDPSRQLTPMSEMSSVTDEAIAVLPLENMSGDPSQEYIADGLTETLITDLARVGSLKVISRTSVMGYKGTTKPAAEIGAELGVGVIVAGSVLVVDERVRISAQLIHAATDEHLWAGQYDRELSDVLALQSEIAQAIAVEVQARLGLGSLYVDLKPRKVDAEVFLLDLKGRHQLTLRTEESFRKAQRYFQQAAENDPTYAHAFVGQADTFNMLVNYGFLPVSLLDRSRAALERALELDDTVSEAYRALGHMRWLAEFDQVGAEKAFRQAIQLEPNTAINHYWYGAFLIFQARFEEGLAEFHQSQALDPLSLLVIAVMGWAHYFARKFDKAVPYYEQTLQIDPDFFFGRWSYGQVLIELEDYDRGIRELERAAELGGNMSRSWAYLGYGYGRAGERDKAESILRKLEERAKQAYVPPYFSAVVYSGLGEIDAAFDYLEKAANLPDSMIRDLKVDPPLEILRSDPRYVELLHKINLEP